MTVRRKSIIETYLDQQNELGLPPYYILNAPKTDTEITEDTPTSQEPPAQPVPAKREQLATLYYETRECTSCVLSQTRKNYVFGAGNVDSGVLIIGEAPGNEEDQQGLPFVGSAGDLLKKMLGAIDLGEKDDTFIANILKCRTPGNRPATDAEAHSCMPILRRQIAILKPTIILALGEMVLLKLLGVEEPLKKVHGTTYHYMDIPVIPTYLPSTLLRNSSLKADAWSDLQKFQQLLKERRYE